MTIATMCPTRIFIKSLLHSTIFTNCATNPLTTNNSHDNRCPLLLLLFQLLLLLLSRFYFSFLFSPKPFSRYDNSFNLHPHHNPSHSELIAFIWNNSSLLASTTVALQGWFDNGVSTSPHLCKPPTICI
jgi:hypothetical protein